MDDETGRRLVRTWSDAGHLIGNHSYSHLSYNDSDVSFDQFSGDLLRGEAVISGLPGFQKLFRFPFLKEGDTAAKRDQMRAFLAKHGYRNGQVTIDASDWYYDQRLRERLRTGSCGGSSSLPRAIPRTSVGSRDILRWAGTNIDRQEYFAHHPAALHAAQ